MLGDRNDIGTGHLGDGDAAVYLVGHVEVDVIGSDARRNGELEVLGLAQTFCGEVAWVEADKAKLITRILSFHNR